MTQPFLLRRQHYILESIVKVILYPRVKQLRSYNSPYRCIYMDSLPVEVVLVGLLGYSWLVQPVSQDIEMQLSTCTL